MATEGLFGAYNFQLEVAGVRVGSFRSIRQSAGAGPAIAERRDPAGLKWNPAGHKVTPAGPNPNTAGLKWNPRSMKMGNTKPGAALDNLGPARSSTLVLEGFRPERGQEWMFRGGSSALGRKPGKIVLLDQSSKPVAQWNFTNAWPSKVSGPSPKADGNDISMEEITLVFEQVRRVP